jgi:flavin-binding protein dodecin
MPNKTYKIVDVVGVSDQSIHQAVRNALKKAGQTLRNIDWFEVQDIRGLVNKQCDPEFQVTLRIGFRLEEGPVD